MEEERWENYYKLPKKVLDIMEWLCDTKFYKKTYEERAEYYKDINEDINEKWKFCDFRVIVGTCEEPKLIEIGELPTYKGDTKKALVINLVDKESCYLERGYAVGLNASRVLSNKYKIPKYMKDQLYNFIDALKEGK